MCDGLGLSSLEYGAVDVSGRCGRSYVLCVQERLYGRQLHYRFEIRLSTWTEMLSGWQSRCLDLFV